MKLRKTLQTLVDKVTELEETVAIQTGEIERLSMQLDNDTKANTENAEDTYHIMKDFVSQYVPKLNQLPTIKQAKLTDRTVYTKHEGIAKGVSLDITPVTGSKRQFIWAENMTDERQKKIYVALVDYLEQLNNTEQ